MSFPQLYALAGIVLFVLGLHAVILRTHLMRKILALNVMSSGVFLILAALGRRGQSVAADPVPHALVITGIVVAVAATALMLVLMLRIVAATGGAELPHRDPSE